MSFNESNTVEQMILDAVENPGLATAVSPMHKTRNCWVKFSLGSEK